MNTTKTCPECETARLKAKAQKDLEEAEARKKQEQERLTTKRDHFTQECIQDAITILQQNSEWFIRGGKKFSGLPDKCYRVKFNHWIYDSSPLHNITITKEEGTCSFTTD